MAEDAGSRAEEICRAAAVLRGGGLVAFPTETVYGLGADARLPDAVQKIFAAKGRPATNPLIVHVIDENAARSHAAEWPEVASVLARTFWPGPLTLVVRRGPSLAPAVSAGLGSVGLRAPDHPIARALLQEFGGPIAAPSANRSNRISPTTAAHVRREFGDEVGTILDGGPCAVGLESTVIDLTSHVPNILRPGGVSQQQIEKVIGPVARAEFTVSPLQAARSPGQQSIHYAPSNPAFRFSTDQAEPVAAWAGAHPEQSAVFLLRDRSVAVPLLRNSISSCHRMAFLPAEAEAYARQFYAALHEADTGVGAVIWIELPPLLPRWAAVRDRIQRATRQMAAE